MSPLRWTTKSLRALSAELARQGHRARPDTLAGLLHEEGFSLQGNAKSIEGNQVPDRDTQFRYLNEQVREHRDAGEPAVSAGTKKKELAGKYRNGGHEWRPADDPVLVKDHDFPDQELGNAIPYGSYDLAANTGWVNVGTDPDTAAFAVGPVRRWWYDAGRDAYPGARRLLITADSGGSNSSRGRAWKLELAALALETGLEITACHFPPGTSKWNKIEHRLFARITMNWRGRPLASQGCRSGHRRHRGRRRAHRPRRTGHRDLPARREDQRRADSRAAHAAPRLARRLELHPSSRAAGPAVSPWGQGRPGRAPWLGAPRPDRHDRRRLGPAHRRPRRPLPGPAQGRPAHRPRRPGQPEATRQH